ncbi:HipA family kinase [Moheibacter stercoris]|uniref:HipA-like kinase domain-containing protein n=1 Tax=Moheibacter stercoris TaxID=1628251 RepID=A0ABV2LWW2_9FLAO
MELRSANLTRYILPLREGGSLPALAEADDGFKYVVKFKGSGHREKSVIAELLGGEIARKLGFKVPELIFLCLDEAFGRTEADEEIQDLLQASQGLNLGLHFLSGSINYDPNVMKIDPKLASEIVWLDAYITNVDRTFRNTNMLMWHKELWLIDHGSSFYFHHSWDNWEKQAQSPFAFIKDHVLLPFASEIQEAEDRLKPLMTDEFIDELVRLLPDEWLNWDYDLEPNDLRKVYADFLKIRRDNSQLFVKEAQNARQNLI